MVNWERFDIDGAEDLPDSYTQEDRYYYQAKLGNLTLSVGACYYNDLFAGWGWHIEQNGMPVVEFTFRSHRDAFDTSKEAKLAFSFTCASSSPKSGIAIRPGCSFRFKVDKNRTHAMIDL
jgi:hypothetical protein